MTRPRHLTGGECALTRLTQRLKMNDVIVHGEQICEQGFADYKWDGINAMAVKKAWRTK